MATLKQINCFKMNMIFWKILGIYPFNDTCRYYNLYTRFCFVFIIVSYDFLLTLNFYFLPRHLDAFIEEMLFYFTEASVASKYVTFLLMRKKIVQLLEILESNIFQPVTNEEFAILKRAKKFNVTYWKIVAVISITSHLTHVLSLLFAHIFFSVPLELPICSYSFLSDETKQKHIYIIYFYQYIGMQFHMLCNLNIDTFFLGVMILTIAQLDILKEKLSTLCNNERISNGNQASETEKESYENNIIMKFNQSIIHYDEVYRFCELFQGIFSFTLFVQFSMASCIICICLFRFTLNPSGVVPLHCQLFNRPTVVPEQQKLCFDLKLNNASPATIHYYVFLATYMFIMVIQILVPCWFGTQIVEKSCLLSQAVYSCDWTARPRKFKSSLRLFVERANRPLTITGGKMFPLSLVTFSSIMNSAYSFFTLLRHMQTR